MKRTRHFREAMRQSPSLRAVLMKYVQAFMVQTAHTAIANAREADIEAISVDVRLWPIADLSISRQFVRFGPKADIKQRFAARSMHWRRP